MKASDLIQIMEAAAQAALFYRGAAPATVFLNPVVLQSMSTSDLWELPQVQQAQVSGAYRVLRRLFLSTGIVEVKEDPDEVLFRFE